MNARKIRSPSRRRKGTVSSATTSGLARKASTTARISPSPQAPSAAKLPSVMVSPSMVNATISARLPSAVWKRSISRLYGARASPRTIPARKTARKPDPWATVAAPYTANAPASIRSGYRPSLGSGTLRMNHFSASPAPTPTAAPISICSAKTNATRPAVAPTDPVAAPSNPAIKAMPTGSFAPDSPAAAHRYGR